MVIFLDCIGPASDEQIDELEKKVGLRFPGALRRLFREVNGARPAPCIYRDNNNDTDVSECLAIREGKGSALWTYELLVLSKRLVPSQFFPFAVDSGGDFFLWTARPLKPACICMFTTRRSSTFVFSAPALMNFGRV